MKSLKESLGLNRIFYPDNQGQLLVILTYQGYLGQNGNINTPRGISFSPPWIWLAWRRKNEGDAKLYWHGLRCISQALRQGRREA